MNMQTEKKEITKPEVNHKVTGHRLAVTKWKQNNPEALKAHKRTEYINRKIKFIFLNILLEN